MEMKIEYTDGMTQRLEGEYEIHENYISIKDKTTNDENYPWNIVIVPLHAFVLFEAHP